MKLRFLCGTHRQELSNKPEQAIHCWQNGFDTGLLLSDQRMWKEALPHLGCAFETSEIILTTRAVNLQYACELFTSSAALLADIMKNLGYEDQCREIYWMTINRLESELSSHPEGHAWINQHLSQLYEFIQYPDAISNPLSFSITTASHQQRAAVH